MSKIKGLIAREILDSRGNPTLEAELKTNEGVFRSAVPSGASTGKHEALELRDGGKRFAGRGVLLAARNINEIISKKILSKNPENQKEIDELMIDLDGTPNKSKLGANAILAVSMAVCRAGAAARQVRLHEYIRQISAGKKLVLPTPAMNIINGGVHAGNSLDFQEFMILPTGAKSFGHAMQLGAETYHHLKKIISEKYGRNASNVGDEGGFAPPLWKVEDAFKLVWQSIEELGYDNEIQLGIDCAASEFYKGFAYRFEGREISKEKLARFYEDIVSRYNVITIEDPFQEDDFDSFSSLTARLGDKLQIVGDDLLVTNPKRLQIAIRQAACNCLLLKVNQIGTVSEAIEAANLAKENKIKVMVSHRSGETEDTFIADLAVGLGCGQIKSGAPCRGERTAKYNQLLRIEQDLGNKAIFQGKIL